MLTGVNKLKTVQVNVTPTKSVASSAPKTLINYFKKSTFVNDSNVATPSYNEINTNDMTPCNNNDSEDYFSKHLNTAEVDLPKSDVVDDATASKECKIIEVIPVVETAPEDITRISTAANGTVDAIGSPVNIAASGKRKRNVKPKNPIDDAEPESKSRKRTSVKSKGKGKAVEQELNVENAVDVTAIGNVVDVLNTDEQIDGEVNSAHDSVSKAVEIETSACEASKEEVSAPKTKKRVRKASLKSKENKEVDEVLDALIGAEHIAVDGTNTKTPASIEWKADAYIKLKYNMKRLQTICNEFNSYEYRGEYRDTGIHVDDAVQDILSALVQERTPKSAKETENDSPLKSEDIDKEMELSNITALCPIKTYLARMMQGSCLTLTQLSTMIIGKLKEIQTSATSYAEDTGSGPVSVYLNDLLSNPIVLEDEMKQIAKREEYGVAVPPCCSVAQGPEDCPVVTGEIERTESGKMQLESHEESATSLWRWECHLLSYFPTHISVDKKSNMSTSNIIGEIRSIRGKFSRLIKAIGKLMDQLVKDKGCIVEAKVTPIDTRIAKCAAEVEKYKDRVRESDRKKLQQATEAAEKEHIAEMKRKEKEELMEARRREKEELQAKKLEETLAKQAEKEKEKQLAAEKEAKKLAALNKQKSLLFNFVKAAPPPSSVEKQPPSAEEIIVVDGKDGPAVAASAAGPVAISSSASPGAVTSKCLNYNAYVGKLYVSNGDGSHRLVSTSNHAHNSKLGFDSLPCRFFDPVAFESALKNPNSLKNDSRKVLRTKNLHPKRKPVYVSGTVVVPDGDNLDSNGIPDAFNSNPSYTEVKEFPIDPFMKNLKFYEDVRPAYCGTFSKGRGKKTGISGRRPFYCDEEIFNYDYDSEADWDEEDEKDGEDIAMSDGEDSEQEGETGAGYPDGTEYDEFYRPDSDYGSDIEDENEALLIKNSRRQQNKGVEVERYGPCFITSGVAAAEVGARVTPERETRIQYFCPSQPNANTTNTNNPNAKLLNYGTVFYPHTSAYLPVLGQNVQKMGKSSDTLDQSKSKLKKKSEQTALEAAIPKLLQYAHGSKEGIDRLVAGFVGDNEKTDAEGASGTVLAKALIKRVITEHAVRRRGVVDKPVVEMAAEGSSSSVNSAPTTPTVERYGSNRWCVHNQSWEKYCADLQQPELIFTPPRVHKNGKRRIELTSVTDESGVASNEKPAKTPKKDVPTVSERIKKEKKRIAPTLVSTETAEKVSVAAPVSTTSTETPAKKEKKRIAPTLVSTPITEGPNSVPVCTPNAISTPAIVSSATATTPLASNAPQTHIHTDGQQSKCQDDIMTLENGEEVQLPKSVAQSNTLSMFFKKTTSTPANTPIRQASTPNATTDGDIDEDCAEETKECDEYYDGSEEDSNAGGLVISC